MEANPYADLSEPELQALRLEKQESYENAFDVYVSCREDWVLVMNALKDLSEQRRQPAV